MNKILLLFFVTACSQKNNQQQKAEEAVHEYIKQNANDPASYRPVSFGKLDTVFSLDSTQYATLDEKRRAILTQYNAAINQQRKMESEQLRTALEKINTEIDNTRKVAGLKIYHISQGKNMQDEMVTNRGTFYLDTNFTVQEFIMTEDSLLDVQNY